MFNLRDLLRRRFNQRLGIGLLSLLLMVSFSACRGNPAADTEATSRPISGATGDSPAEFRIGYQLSAGPETLVKQLGTMEAQFPQVSIRWQAYDSGLAVNDAIATGIIDAGLIGSVPVSTGIAKELPYQVYFIMNILGDSEALAVTEESGITTTAGLIDKIIGVPFGSTTHFSLLSALERDGIDPDDVTILDMQPQDLLAAWQFGEIDGGYVWQPTLSRMLDEGGSILTSSREMAESGFITADLGVVSKEFAAQYPAFLQHYVAALDSAVILYREDPQAAAIAMSEALALSPKESLTVMNGLLWLSAEDQRSAEYIGTPESPGGLSQVLKDSAEFMVEQGEILSAPGLSTYKEALLGEALIPPAIALDKKT